MKQEDIDQLITLKNNAPATWRCCSLYYGIIFKYGFGLHNDDDEIAEFVDKYVK